MNAENIRVDYEPAILEVMERWKRELEDMGHEVGDIIDVADEEYAWDMDVVGKAGITVKLLESEVLAGISNGFNWSVEAIGEGGRIIGRYVPYNFTPDVWTDDPAEIERRFRLVTETDIVEAITEALA